MCHWHDVLQVERLKKHYFDGMKTQLHHNNLIHGSRPGAPFTNLYLT